MDRRDNTKALVNTALSSAVAVIIAIIGLFVPFMSFVSFLWPVPIIIVIKRYGFKYGVYATLVSGVIVGMVSQPLYAVYLILGFGAIGLAIGIGVSKGYQAGFTLIIASVVSLISKLLLIYITTRIMGVNPLNMQIESIEKSVELYSRFYSDIGLKDAENVKSMFLASIEIIKLVMPALLIFAAVLDSFLNYTVAQLILKRLKLYMKPLPPFARWRFPRNVTLGFVLLVVLAYIGGYLGMVDTYIVMNNIIILFSIIFAIQGLSVIYHYLSSKGLPRFLTAILMIFLIINQVLAMVTLITGLLDVIFDFRKISSEK